MTNRSASYKSNKPHEPRVRILTAKDISEATGIPLRECKGFSKGGLQNIKGVSNKNFCYREDALLDYLFENRDRYEKDIRQRINAAYEAGSLDAAKDV